MVFDLFGCHVGGCIECVICFDVVVYCGILGDGDFEVGEKDVFVCVD